MERWRNLVVGSGFLTSLILAAGSALEASGLTFVSHLDNGRRIYMSGVTAQGQVIQNSHGMEGVGCAMCHGPSGTGGSMHGIAAPNITFAFLTDPQGYEHPTGRKRPAYNEETIKAAIVAGIDAGGNRLHPEMPRWTGLTAKDVDDLIGFLKTLNTTRPRTYEGAHGV